LLVYSKLGKKTGRKWDCHGSVAEEEYKKQSMLVGKC